MSQKAGKRLPWAVVHTALNATFQTRMLERTVDSGPWPCDLPGAANLLVRLPGTPPPPPVKPPELVKPAGVVVAQTNLDLAQIQDLADQVPELKKAVVGFPLKLHLRIELEGTKVPPPELIAKINAMLAEVAKELKLE